VIRACRVHALSGSAVSDLNHPGIDEQFLARNAELA
jgi:hypothetical protein